MIKYIISLTIAVIISNVVFMYNIISLADMNKNLGAAMNSQEQVIKKMDSEIHILQKRIEHLESKQ